MESKIAKEAERSLIEATQRLSPEERSPRRTRLSMRTTRSGESALLLLDAVEVLVASRIECAVVGAIAASIHGAVRASMDADVVLSLAVQEAKELEQTF